MVCFSIREVTYGHPRTVNGRNTGQRGLRCVEQCEALRRGPQKAMRHAGGVRPVTDNLSAVVDSPRLRDLGS